jgi:hypothetical protein
MQGEIMRPPKKIVLSDEIKSFLRKRHKEPFLAAIAGKKRRNYWQLEKVVMLVPGLDPDDCCPKGRKPFKGITGLIGTIHKHKEGIIINKERLLANKIHIIITGKEKVAWFKTDNYMIEMRI